MEDRVLKELGRIVAGAYYDHQSVRISSMNRMRDVIRKKNEGIPFDKVEEKKEKKTYSKEYQDKNLPILLKQMLEEKKLTEKEYDYIRRILEVTKEAKKNEDDYKKLMFEYIETEEIYKKFLSKIIGLGPVLSCNLIRLFGYCEGYRHVSSVWKHSGLHVVNGQAPKRKRGEKLDWNPTIRTFCWKIADSFVKQRTPVSSEIYETEKRRQIELMKNKAKNAPKNLKHADLRARRKMIKIFLQHYWLVGRKLKGLDTGKPYAVEKLGHHYITPEEVIAANEERRKKRKLKK